MTSETNCVSSRKSEKLHIYIKKRYENMLQEPNSIIIICLLTGKMNKIREKKLHQMEVFTLFCDFPFLVFLSATGISLFCSK